jgi:protein involved in temperature-dependent protein secretion
MIKYIIEFRWKCADGTMSRWTRSTNSVRTQPEFRRYHDTYAFDTLQEAIREMRAQTDTFEYRATPVLVLEPPKLEVDPLFSFTTMSTEGKEKTVAIAEAFTTFLRQLEEILPGNSREISIVKTKLEEASFYAKKALRNYEGNRA